MTSTSNESLNDYIARLSKNPQHGHITIIRITNKRSIPLGVQIEPTGDEAPQLEQNCVYQVVVQDRLNEYGSLDIFVQDDGVRVWVEGADGQVFSEGVSVAY